MASALYRSYVLVSREQIARNHLTVRAVVGPRVEVAAVVKADAYGHGAGSLADRHRRKARSGSPSAPWKRVSRFRRGGTAALNSPRG